MRRWHDDPVLLGLAAVATGVGAGLAYIHFIKPEADDDVPQEGFDVVTTVTALTPDTQYAYAQLEDVMLKKYGIRLRRGQTVRSPAQQAKAVADGASATNISWHMVGRAIDAYPIDPATGVADMQGRNIDLFRKMHREWHALGGLGLAFRPYPEGELRYINTVKNGVPRKTWDGGHLEFHGEYASAREAWNVLQSA